MRSWRESSCPCLFNDIKSQSYSCVVLICVHDKWVPITTAWHILRLRMEKLTEQCQESIIIPVHEKGNETDCNNHRGISLLSTTYKILSNILLSRLTPYVEEMIRYHQCGFWHDRSITDHNIFICQILQKNWEYNEAVHQLFIDFKKANESVRMEVVCNILIELNILKKMSELKKNVS
jgi:hypothetical protein